MHRFQLEAMIKRTQVSVFSKESRNNRKPRQAHAVNELQALSCPPPPASFCDGKLAMKEKGVGSLNVGPGRNRPHDGTGEPSDLISGSER